MNNTIRITLERQSDSMGCHPNYKYLAENKVEIEIDLELCRGQEIAIRRVGVDESIYVPIKVLRMLLSLIDGTGEC